MRGSEAPKQQEINFQSMFNCKVANRWAYRNRNPELVSR